MGKQQRWAVLPALVFSFSTSETLTHPLHFNNSSQDEFFSLPPYSHSITSPPNQFEYRTSSKQQLFCSRFSDSGESRLDLTIYIRVHSTKDKSVKHTTYSNDIAGCPLCFTRPKFILDNMARCLFSTRRDLRGIFLNRWKRMIQTLLHTFLVFRNSEIVIEFSGFDSPFLGATI